eukprot:COSAG01_NODE_31211_length_601_cov_2.866534_1_plen_93_part_10
MGVLAPKRHIYYPRHSYTVVYSIACIVSILCNTHSVGQRHHGYGGGCHGEGGGGDSERESVLLGRCCADPSASAPGGSVWVACAAPAPPSMSA